jgi:hypothetical protein
MCSKIKNTRTRINKTKTRQMDKILSNKIIYYMSRALQGIENLPCPVLP